MAAISVGDGSEARFSDVVLPQRRNRMMGTCRRLSLVGLLVMLAVASALGAQSTTGSIQGTVRDKQDAVVPGATVTIRNVADQREPDRGHRQQRGLSLPQHAGRRLRADGGALGLLEARPLRAHARAQPGRRRRRPASAGRGDRDHRGARRRAAAQHDQRRSRRPVRHDPRRRAAGDEQPQHLHAGAVGAWRQPARQRPDGLRAPGRTSRRTARGCARTTS